VTARAALAVASMSISRVQIVTAQTPELVLGTVFGPVTVIPGISVKACANNLFGAGPVDLNVAFLDAVTGVPISTRQQLRVASGGGVCTNPSNSFPAPQPLVVVLSAPVEVAWEWRTKGVLSTSVQIIDPQSRSSSFLPAIQISRAVEVPVAAQR
jgi:hypothetical protein